MVKGRREAFQNALMRWFEQNGRDLPWRRDYDPYHVWLSEVMLQQTQMERGVDYFERWINRFPDIEAVAEASVDEILKYWEGLGYYARARNLHRAALYMVETWQGRVPRSVDALLALPGVGAYTAAAIASIAYEQDVPLVDANVERVFARVFDVDTPLAKGITKKRMQQLASEMLPHGCARIFNQALMELGALICTPKNPLCHCCPVAEFCRALEGQIIEDRPVKKRPQEIIPVHMVTGILLHKGAVFIQQRKNEDIWGGLWEFPGGKIEEGESPEQALVREYREETAFTVRVEQHITSVVHHYTRYKVFLSCHLCSLQQASMLPELREAQKYHWLEWSQLNAYAFPAGHRKCLDYIEKNCSKLFMKGV